MITRNTYYRAKVWRGGRLIAKMDGKYNTKEQLDAWLAQNWPGELKYQSVPEGRSELTLTIWRYWGSRLDRVILNARMPTS